MPSSREQLHRARVAETIGLLIITLVILGITLARYGHAIHWSLR